MSENIYQQLWNQKRIKKSNLNFDYSFLPNSQNMKPRQIVWHLLHNTIDIPKCQNENCNNDVKWNTNNRKSYRIYCSIKCMKNSKEIKEKFKQTNLKKYGVENPSQSKYIQNIIKRNNLKKHGVIHTQQLKEVREKQKKTNFDRYGVNYIKQLNYLKETKKILKSNEKFNDFLKTKTIQKAADELGINETTIRRYIKKYNTQYLKTKSSFELEMEEFLKENNISFIQNDRNQIKPKELDFYIPKYNLAIECNGDYWHSMRKEGYHINKYNLCKEKEIKLLHIWEVLWNENRNEMKEFILENIQ